MNRREFVAALGGVLGGAASGPFVVGAQEARMRRLGVLMSLNSGDRESQVRLGIFLRALQEIGWSEERLHIDTRWGDDNVDRTRAATSELMALSPDVMLASGSTAAHALQQATRGVPVVFVQVAAPLGEQLVESLAHPGGNVTGFASIEAGMPARWVDLLREIAPRIRRLLVIRDPASDAGRNQFEVIAARARTLGIAVDAVGVRDASGIEGAIKSLAREPDGGLIVTTSTRASAHRELMLAGVARHKLPAIYPFRHYVAAGGLVSYGADYGDQYRRAAGYVDRILMGEKPADMPVQIPQKYETVVNRRSANAMGIVLPPALLARADEVIE